MEDGTEKDQLYPSLSGNPKVRVCYGNKNINDIIESLILLDVNNEMNYNKIER